MLLRQAGKTRCSAGKNRFLITLHTWVLKRMVLIFLLWLFPSINLIWKNKNLPPRLLQNISGCQQWSVLMVWRLIFLLSLLCFQPLLFFPRKASACGAEADSVEALLFPTTGLPTCPSGSESWWTAEPWNKGLGSETAAGHGQLCKVVLATTSNSGSSYLIAFVCNFAGSKFISCAEAQTDIVWHAIIWYKVSFRVAPTSEKEETKPLAQQVYPSILGREREWN